MASVWEELKRRNVVKVAMAYAIVGWLLIEITSTVFPTLQLPVWTVTFVTMLLLLGFPVALLLSWAYELTPEGVKKTKAVPLTDSVTHVTGRKIDFVIIAALILALGFVVVDNYVLDGPEPEVATLELAPTAEAFAGALPNSVAVLPFKNLSDDPENAYFAAGIHEEVLNQLVKLSELNVIARTSMMQYAAGDKSIPQVARELNVETVMEGSVRYADGRVLVTAQLIDPVTNAHLWSESYNREFADIFAIQADIAMNIANALEAEFSLEEQANMERAVTASPEAYSLYLRARTLVPNPAYASQDELNSARSLIDRAIEIDADFARAYVTRSTLYRGSDASDALTEQDLQTALELDPSLGFAYARFGSRHIQRHRGAEALEAFELGVRSSPNDPEVLGRYSWLRSLMNEHEEAIRLATRTVQLDPGNPLYLEWLGGAHLLKGDDESAIEAYQRAIAVDPAYQPAYALLGRIEAGRGNQAEAAEYLARAEQLGNRALFFIAYGYRLAGFHEELDRLAARIVAARPNQEQNPLILGDYEQLLANGRTNLDEGRGGGRGNRLIMANVFNDPALETAEWIEFRNRFSAALFE